MTNSIDFYKIILLHVIPVRIIVSCLNKNIKFSSWRANLFHKLHTLYLWLLKWCKILSLLICVFSLILFIFSHIFCIHCLILFEFIFILFIFSQSRVFIHLLNIYLVLCYKYSVQIYFLWKHVQCVVLHSGKPIIICSFLKKINARQTE